MRLIADKSGGITLFQFGDAFLVEVGEAGDPEFIGGALFVAGDELLALFLAEGFAFGAC